MAEPDAVLEAMRRAIEVAPDEPSLRLHLAELLLAHGRPHDSVEHLAVVLRLDPGHAEARALMRRALGVEADAPDSSGAPDPAQPLTSTGDHAPDGFDWPAAEDDLDSAVPPMFAHADDDEPAPLPLQESSPPSVTLSDVAGMAKVKERLEAAFLAPLRNPRLRALFGSDLRGGLLLYGPPGCGKTFVARAVAGEMGARFVSVSLADVLDVYTGQSERNLRELFALARRNAPCVVFFDEVDALGQKRSQLQGSSMRRTVNQLLEELDGLAANEGVFVLAATNHPWDVDTALRRPGRFDRVLLVTPPGEEARTVLLTRELARRPVADIELDELVRLTDGYSGADLVHLCRSAAERALLDSARTGQVRMVVMDDLRAVLEEIRPSVASWLQTARNVALFANEGGQYDELVAYLEQRRVL
jgi:AAA+ superfamily predicted ATPase